MTSNAPILLQDVPAGVSPTRLRELLVKPGTATKGEIVAMATAVLEVTPVDLTARCNPSATPPLFAAAAA